MKVPEEYCVITADILKWIALVTMTLDHMAECVVRGFVIARGAYLSQQYFQIVNTAYNAMRHLGRMAFPLFAFLLVEGFFKTRNRRKYIVRMFLAAFISEVPFDLMLSGKAVAWETQNTMFTLVIGLLVLWRMAYLEESCHSARWIIVAFQAAVCGLGALTAYVCKTDYSYKGIALIVVFYLFYHYRTSAAVAGFCTFCWEPWSLPAFVLIPFYNGVRRQRAKSFFYLYYPIHLLVLYFILQIIT